METVIKGFLEDYDGLIVLSDIIEISKAKKNLLNKLKNIS